MGTVKRHSMADDAEPAKKCPYMPSEYSERPTKRRKLDVESSLPLSDATPEPPAENQSIIRPLCHWPDDIIIHLLQFLDLETLENFDITCKRVHFFVRLNLKHLLEPFINSLPLTNDLQYIINARSEFQSFPPRASFSYYRLLQSIYRHFDTIANQANPLKKCPREILHPDIDYHTLQPSTIHFFRRNYCYYFSDPIPSIAHFWTIFWEYKRVKKVYPGEGSEKFLERVRKWAWDRYTAKEIMGIARFNGCYYSRIITSSLNCQRDALKMVLEIYNSRDSTHEIWSVNNG